MVLLKGMLIWPTHAYTKEINYEYMRDLTQDTLGRINRNELQLVIKTINKKISISK